MPLREMVALVLVGLAEQEVIMVPWLLRELAVKPGAQEVHWLAAKQRMQLAVQGWHWLVLLRNCPEGQVGALATH